MGVRGTADTPPLEPGRSAPPATLRRVGLARQGGGWSGPGLRVRASAGITWRTALVIASHPRCCASLSSSSRRAHRTTSSCFCRSRWRK